MTTLNSEAARSLNRKFALRKQILILHKEAVLLVTFTTNAYADITMFGDVAIKLLKMMGHSATVPGAILAEDIPGALDRLTNAINAEKPLPQVQDKDEDEQVVSMAHRGLPLINLLTAAVKANCNVMWK